MMAFVLASPVPCARDDVEKIQAQSPELFLNDPAYIDPFLARAMYDVCEAGALEERRASQELHSCRAL